MYFAYLQLKHPQIWSWLWKKIDEVDYPRFMLFFCFISFFKCASKFASRISPKQWQKIILKLGNICNNLQKKSDIWLSAEGRFELSKTIQQKFCSHFSTIFLVKKSYFLLLMSEINDNDVWNVTFIVRLTHMQSSETREWRGATRFATRLRAVLPISA